MSLEELAAQFGSYREITNYNLKRQVGNSTPTVSEGASEVDRPESSKPNNDGAVVNHIADSGFNQKLYKHISDHYAGDGQVSKDVNFKLAAKDVSIAGNLNQYNPSAGALYAGYRTASFSYNSQARFISGIDSSTKLSDDIRRIFKV